MKIQVSVQINGASGKTSPYLMLYFTSYQVFPLKGKDPNKSK